MREKLDRETNRAVMIEEVKQILQPGDTVYCVLRHRATSGMMRHISFFTVRDGGIRYLDHYIAELCGYKYASDGRGVKIRGCGMDMGWHVVYNLGAILWPDGTPEPHGTRNGELDRDGGYALRSSWI